jgi:hypothetical protein
LASAGLRAVEVTLWENAAAWAAYRQET